MNKRGAGIALIAVAAFLFASRYVSAAIFGSGLASWSSDLYDSMLIYVGSTLHNLSLLALLAGIAYLVWGEVEELRK